MTRLSAAIYHQSDAEGKVFVAYEPRISASYMGYLFKDGEAPKKTYKNASPEGSSRFRISGEYP